MNTAGILESKGNGVVTATSGKSLLYIARLLAQYCIGCVVIVEDDDKVLGIISEHDLMRAIARDGPKTLSRPVSDFMTTTVFMAGKTDTSDWLMSEMITNEFRHIPVLEKGKLVGIVSIGDLVKLHVRDAESESSELRRHISSA